MIRKWILALGLLVMSLGGLVVLTPQTAFAAPSDACNQGFMGFPSWYRGLTQDKGADKCAIKSPSDLNSSSTSNDGISRFIWTVALNVVEIVLVAIAYLSAFYTLYGGFIFIVSRGRPEEAAKARGTILDSVIGLIISMAAVAIVNFIATGIM